MAGNAGIFPGSLSDAWRIPGRYPTESRRGSARPDIKGLGGAVPMKIVAILRPGSCTRRAFWHYAIHSAVVVSPIAERSCLCRDRAATASETSKLQVMAVDAGVAAN